MSTNKSTWQPDDIWQAAKLRHGSPKKFMHRIYWDILEHDWATAGQLAKTPPKNYKKLRRLPRSSSGLTERTNSSH